MGRPHGGLDGGEKAGERDVLSLIAFPHARVGEAVEKVIRTLREARGGGGGHCAGWGGARGGMKAAGSIKAGLAAGTVACTQAQWRAPCRSVGRVVWGGLPAEGGGGGTTVSVVVAGVSCTEYSERRMSIRSMTKSWFTTANVS